ncbi:hypothetical protein [Amphritea sp. HPY]|uniref:hypothetical protein n=1 Tax=Amphritea sp. HPY TaxID=3421652 RepID=UPI003D7CA40C
MFYSLNETSSPIVKSRPTAGKNRFRNVLIFALTLTLSATPQPSEAALTLSATPQPSEAAWWWVGKAIKKIIDFNNKKYRKADRYGRDKSDEDGYNPYHNHPDGLPPSDHPPYYN